MHSLEKWIIFTVPPHQLLIFNSSGTQVKDIVGPYQVGMEFGLMCEVRGGMFPIKFIIHPINNKHTLIIICFEWK